MESVTLESLRGVAIKGVMARPAGNHEALVTAQIKGDRMTIAYGARRREQVSPRRWKCVESLRLVQCERRWNDKGDDWWWYGVAQTVLSG